MLFFHTWDTVSFPVTSTDKIMSKRGRKRKAKRILESSDEEKETIEKPILKESKNPRLQRNSNALLPAMKLGDENALSPKISQENIHVKKEPSDESSLASQNSPLDECNNTTTSKIPQENIHVKKEPSDESSLANQNSPLDECSNTTNYEQKLLEKISETSNSIAPSSEDNSTSVSNRVNISSSIVNGGSQTNKSLSEISTTKIKIEPSESAVLCQSTLQNQNCTESNEKVVFNDNIVSEIKHEKLCSETSNLKIKEEPEDSDDDIIILDPPLQIKKEKIEEIVIDEGDSETLNTYNSDRNMQTKIKEEPPENVANGITTENTPPPLHANVSQPLSVNNNITAKQVKLIHFKNSRYLNLNTPLIFEDLYKVFHHAKALDSSMDQLEPRLLCNKIARPNNTSAINDRNIPKMMETNVPKIIETNSRISNDVNVSQKVDTFQINVNELKKIVNTAQNIFSNMSSQDNTTCSAQNPPTKMCEPERKKLKTTHYTVGSSNLVTNADLYQSQPLLTSVKNLNCLPSNIETPNIQKTTSDAPRDPRLRRKSIEAQNILSNTASTSQNNISARHSLYTPPSTSLHMPPSTSLYTPASTSLYTPASTSLYTPPSNSLYIPPSTSTKKTNLLQPVQSAASKYSSAERPSPIQSFSSLAVADKTAVKNFQKFMRKQNVVLMDIILLILKWNADWLKLPVSEMPALISDLYCETVDSYDSFEKYYNTYLPLHIFCIWYNIYECWVKNKNLANHYLCITLEEEEVKVNYVKYTTTPIVVKNSEFNNCLKQFWIVLITFTNEGKSKSVFGYIHTCLQRDNNTDEKKVKFVFYTASSLNTRKITILKLFNARINIKQIEGLQSLKNSKMCQVVLNPKEHASKIKRVHIEYDHRFNENLFRIYSYVCMNEVEIILLQMSHTAQPVLTMLKIFEKINQSSVVMICLKRQDRFHKLAEMLTKYNMVLAVKDSEVKIENSFKMYTLREQADKMADISVEKQNAEVLKKSHVILTVLDSLYLDNTENVLSKVNLTCIIDEANSFTEIQTLTPFLYSIKKLILIKNSDDCVKIPECIEKYFCHKSLFNRLTKP